MASEQRTAVLSRLIQYSGAPTITADARAASFEGNIMTTKHPKLNKPMNTDLHRNPLIGGSKGVTMAQASLDDLDETVGENTIEGDVENDANAQGGIDEEPRHLPRSRRGKDHGGPSRRVDLQGRKTHEQQLRILERKPDVPDARQVEQDIARLRENGGARLPKRDARQSEFAVSRGGLNQESQHNKHNRPEKRR